MKKPKISSVKGLSVDVVKTVTGDLLKSQAQTPVTLRIGKAYTPPMPKSPKNRVTIEMPIMSFETDYVGIVNNTEFIRFVESA